MKRWITNLLLKDYLKAVVLENVLEVKKDGLLYIGGKLATENQIINLKQEAKLFKDTLLWQMLMETGRWEAEKQMFKVGKNTDDMFFGKAMLYNRDLDEKIVDFIANIK